MKKNLIFSLIFVLALMGLSNYSSAVNLARSQVLLEIATATW
jgi:hypothetical protein